MANTPPNEMNIVPLKIGRVAMLYFLLLVFGAKAQTDTIDAGKIIYTNAHHFIATLSIQVLPLGILYNRQGDLDAMAIKTRYNMAIDYGFDYNYSINSMLGVGAGFRVKYFSYHYRFTSPDILPEYGCCKASHFTLYNITFDVPLQFIFRYPFKHKYAFRLVAGPSFRFLMHLDDNTIYPFSEQQYFNLTFHPTPIKEAWLVDANAAFGFEMQTKKHHLFFVQGGVNFSFFRRVIGNYQLIKGVDVIQEGMYRQNLSHMEFRLGYVFTGARKKLRKAGLLPPSKVKIRWSQ